LSIGEHIYKVEISPSSGTNPLLEIDGAFTVSENECMKIFLNKLIITLKKTQK